MSDLFGSAVGALEDGALATVTYAKDGSEAALAVRWDRADGRRFVADRDATVPTGRGWDCIYTIVVAESGALVGYIGGHALSAAIRWPIVAV